jgi:hypothetical protein
MKKIPNRYVSVYVNSHEDVTGIVLTKEIPSDEEVERLMQQGTRLHGVFEVEAQVLNGEEKFGVLITDPSQFSMFNFKSCRT